MKRTTLKRIFYDQIKRSIQFTMANYESHGFSADDFIEDCKAVWEDWSKFWIKVLFEAGWFPHLEITEILGGEDHQGEGGYYL